jgi:orotidine-5'-phosphate decarboxylase
MSAPSKIIVALDYASREAALNLTQQLRPTDCILKIGKELFTSAGPDLVRELVAQGFKIFLDLKFHDIPNTVAKAVTAAANLGVWMVNVHAFGGERMLRAAKEALDAFPGEKPLLTAVTILTSMQAEDLATIGLNGQPQEHVLRLAHLAEQCGLDGVVCSSQEVAMLHEACAPDFCLVTPGIRPADYAMADDQRRVMTPVEAIAAGSSYLVIGRPITQAEAPVEVLNMINSKLAHCE